MTNTGVDLPRDSIHSKLDWSMKFDTPPVILLLLAQVIAYATSSVAFYHFDVNIDVF